MNAHAEWLQQLADSIAADSFVRLVLSSPRQADATVQRLQVRLIELQGAKALTFTAREARRDTTYNLSIVDGLAEIERQLSATFESALLATTTADWQWKRTPDGAGKLVRHRPSTTSTPERAHDTAKSTYLGEAAHPFLAALGIVDAAGRTKPKLAHKRAQIDRYVEILAHLARDCGFDTRADHERPLRIVDVGCGKGHLTFAAWHLGRHVLDRAVEVLGVEAQAELVAEANRLAAAVAGPDLRFVRGDISHVELPAPDVLIALHACNTATDHAIRRGVEARAKLIVVAPCCHQEVRPQLLAPEPLTTAMRHGLLAERMAEWATDALRAMVLGWAGYRTKVIEFVSSEHTAKNLLLAGVRSESPPDAAATAAARAQIDSFRAFFGITTHALDALLDRDAHVDR